MTEPAQNLDELLSPRFFKALSDPNRLTIVGQLARCCCPTTVGQVAGCCLVNFSVVSRHLATLSEAGILKAEKRGKEVYYSLQVRAGRGPVEGPGRRARGLLCQRRRRRLLRPAVTNRPVSLVTHRSAPGWRETCRLGDSARGRSGLGPTHPVETREPSQGGLGSRIPDYRSDEPPTMNSWSVAHHRLLDPKTRAAPGTEAPSGALPSMDISIL